MMSQISGPWCDSDILKMINLNMEITLDELCYP